MKHTAIGILASLASMAVLTAAMVPLRSHLDVATAALVLAVPVVTGVVIGGFAAGAVSVVAGFLVYDFCFIPPYNTLSVGLGQDWVTLAVYAAVMLPVAKVVAGLNTARANADRQSKEMRQLFELTDLLVEDKPLDVLLAAIVTTLADAFDSGQVCLLLPRNGRLEIAAYAGQPLTDADLRRVVPPPGTPASVQAPSAESEGLLVLALAAAGRPVGLLVLPRAVAAGHEREPLLLFANHVALAVERAQLREQALRTQLTEEVGRLAKTLIAAVSHDLRTPLASIKASSSTLADTSLALDPDERQQLATLIDGQADRLAELVRDLLDMSRIQAGVLRPRCGITSLDELIGKVVQDLAPALRGHPVEIDLSEDLPPVDIDATLISRVLANLLENAVRHSPARDPIIMRATRAAPAAVELSVTDRGPGVSASQRDKVFEVFSRREGDAGAGLGLTIAKTFVEAHHQRIWVEDGLTGGARFCFTLPAASPLAEEPSAVASAHH